MAQPQPLFVYFRPFLNKMTIVVQNLDYKSVHSVLWIRTRDYWMVGANESLKLLNINGL